MEATFARKTFKEKRETELDFYDLLIMPSTSTPSKDQVRETELIIDDLSITPSSTTTITKNSKEDKTNCIPKELIVQAIGSQDKFEPVVWSKRKQIFDLLSQLEVKANDAKRNDQLMEKYPH